MKFRTLLLNDDSEMNEVVALILKAWQHHQVEIQVADFSFRGACAMREAIDKADICVVGLERKYPWGRRAEGIAVAETLFKHDQKVLLISGENHGARLGVWFYWDLGSPCFLTDSLSECLLKPVPSIQQRSVVAQYFHDRMAMPDPH